MSRPLSPRYQTLPGVIVSIERGDDEILASVRLLTGHRAQAPVQPECWQAGDTVEVLLRKDALGFAHGLALRKPPR